MPTHQIDKDSNILKLHPDIANKGAILSTIDNCYKGGLSYYANPYLPEHNDLPSCYETRKQMLIYVNQLKPLIDYIIGWVYSKKIVRNPTPRVKTWIGKEAIDNMWSSYVKTLATNSLKATSGTLIYYKQEEEGEILNAADEQSLLKLSTKLYTLVNIRNYSVDINGELNWVLLDDSSYDNTDPFADPTQQYLYTLWTRTEKIYIHKSKDGEDWVATDPVPHSLQSNNKVPFVFTSPYSTPKGEPIACTWAEDIVMLSTKIAEMYSFWCSSLIASSRKEMAASSNDLKSLMSQEDAVKGFNHSADVTVIRYSPDTHAPHYLQTGYANIDQYPILIEQINKEMLATLGLDFEKSGAIGAQSGIAKSLEMNRFISMINVFIDQMVLSEKQILSQVNLFLGGSENDLIDIEYEKLSTTDDMTNMLDTATNIVKPNISNNEVLVGDGSNNQKGGN